MAYSTFNRVVLATLTAAFVASSVSIAPAVAGGEGGGGGGGIDSITLYHTNGTSRTIESRKNARTFTFIKRNKAGNIVQKVRKNKKRKTFVTIHNADGTSRTITRVSRNRNHSWASVPASQETPYAITPRPRRPTSMYVH